MSDDTSTTVVNTILIVGIVAAMLGARFVGRETRRLKQRNDELRARLEQDYGDETEPQRPDREADDPTRKDRHG